MKPNPLLRALRLALPFWRGMLLAALLGTLTIASSISLMSTSAWLISKAALQPSIAELSVAVVGVRFFGIARGVFRYLERLVSHETTFRLLAYLRVEFYKRLEPLAPARLVSLRTGDLLSRVIEDIESLQNLYLRAIAPPMVALIIALLFTLFLNLFHPLLAVVTLVLMLAAGIGVPLLAWWGNNQSGADKVALRAELDATLVDNIQGLAETLIYGQAQNQFHKLHTLNQNLAIQEKCIARFDGLQLALTVFLTSAAALIVLVVAIPRIEGIYLATVTLATVAVFEAFSPLAQAAVQLGATAQAARRLFEITDLSPAITDSHGTTNPPINGDLAIYDLSFRYTPDSLPVLHDLSLKLNAGQHIAILGESGSGKSTLVNLLVRFWDYDTGQIMLGGHDLRSYNSIDIRNRFGVMSQHTHIFNTTIRENILIARKAASQDELETAAQQAQIHDFIHSLPDGYDTYIGEGGRQLSGGERQRIALARVLLKQSSIILLDEATANLDADTEYAVMQTVLRVAQERSLLIFTHRHIFLDQMDQVYILKDQWLLPYDVNHLTSGQ